MYNREKRVLLREFLEQGWSKTALAQKLGIHRRTIYHWIATGQLDRDLDVERVRYSGRPPVGRKIDPYLGIIHTRLEQFPKLSSVRLFEEMHAAGYEGKYTQVKEYVRKVRPAPPPEPLVRFETPPGHQGQVDFAHFRLPWGRRWALLVVLSYSRLMWVRFFPRQDMRTLMAGTEQAFRFFGGVPAELLFDQMRSVIVEDRRESGGPLVENIEFLRFAHHWGFRSRACRPYRAKTKGKVERPIRYLRENFFYGRAFLNDQDLDAQLSGWLEKVANVRIHGTTGEKPVDRFEREEQAVLGPLAGKSYLSVKVPQLQKQHSKTRSDLIPRIEVQRRPLGVYNQLVGESV
jgi:transposase